MQARARRVNAAQRSATPPLMNANGIAFTCVHLNAERAKGRKNRRKMSASRAMRTEALSQNGMKFLRQQTTKAFAAKDDQKGVNVALLAD